MKKILIIGAGVLQLPAIQKAKGLGLQVAVVDMDCMLREFCMLIVILKLVQMMLLIF